MIPRFFDPDHHCPVEEIPGDARIWAREIGKDNDKLTLKWRIDHPKEKIKVLMFILDDRREWIPMNLRKR